MDLKKLQQVIAIAREKNISKAAESLYISQSVLSLNLKSIEKELNCTLFQRSTHGLTITYEGERFVDTAQCILSAWDRLKREIHDIKNENCGRVKLGISFSRSPYILPTLATRLHEKKLNIEINAIEGFSNELEEALKKGIIDLALYPLPQKDSSLAVWKEIREEILLCVHKNSPVLKKVHYDDRQNRKWIDVEEIKDEPIISLQAEQKLYSFVNNLYARIGIVPNVVFTTHNMYTAINFVKSGYGMTYIYFLPEQFIDLSGLELISISRQGVYRSLGIVRNPSIYWPKASEQVANVLAELIDHTRAAESEEGNIC